MPTILELFAGTGEVSAEFRKRGFDSFTVDWNPLLDVNLHCDIGQLKIENLPEEFRHPDVVWMAPDCTTYSLAAISHHRVKKQRDR